MLSRVIALPFLAAIGAGALAAQPPPLRPTEGYLPRFTRTAPRAKRERLRLVADFPDGLGLDEWPVTFGVPFPRGALASADNVRIVTAAGQEVPAQIIRTATWHRPDGDVRWVLVDMAARRGTQYFAEFGTEVARKAFPSPLTVSEGDAEIAVTTGPLRVTFSKGRSHLIDGAWLDGNADGRFAEAERVLRAQRRMSMLDQKGAACETSDKPDDYTLTVETRGARRVVVKAAGWYRDAAGKGLCKYVTRVHLYAGRPFVRVIHTFAVAFDTDGTQLRDIAVPFELATGAATGAVFPTGPGFKAATLAAPAASTLVQDAADHFAIRDAQGKVLKEGRRVGGWLDLLTPQGGVAVGLRNMWQEHQKELEATPKGIVAHLWPLHSARPLDFRAPATLGAERFGKWGHRVYWRQWYEGGLDKHDQAMGIAKTNEMILAFHGPDPAPARAACAALGQPPYVAADPAWMCASDVFGPLHPYDPKRFGDIERKWQIAFSRYEFLRDHMDNYGFFDFGDVNYVVNWDDEAKRWAEQPWRRMASRFYGICVMPWTQFVRTGSRRYRRWAIDNARHVMDIDMAHVTGKVEGYRYPKYAGGRYGGNGGIIHYAGDMYPIGCDSHVSQWANCYYLTGYRRAWDILLEEGEFYLEADRARRDGHMLRYAHRMTGGGLRVMIQLWWATWDRRYLDLAHRFAGFCYDAAAKTDDGVIRHDDVYMNPGLVTYYQATGDERMKAIFLRCMRRLNETRLTMSDPRGYTFYGPAMAYYFTGDPSYLCRSVFWMQQYQEELDCGDDPLRRGVPKGRWDMCHNCLQLLYGPYLLGALCTLDKPVEPAGDQSTGADEIWLRNPDGRAFTAKVQWACYKRPFFCGVTVSNWKRYCEKHKSQAEVAVLDPEGKAVARGPMDFVKTPNGAFVSLEVPAGKAGLYRIVQRGAEAIPVKLVLVSEPLAQWVLPTDRGGLSQGPAHFFRVPEGREELALRFKIFVLRKEVTASLLDADGKVVKQATQKFGSEPAAAWTTWTVPVPAGQRGKLWRFQVRPQLSQIQEVLLRLDGLPPVVSITPGAYFVPRRIPPLLRPAPLPAPSGVKTPIRTIPAGQKLVVPRGTKTADARYGHLDARRGTIELWLRPDWDPDDLSDRTILRCGTLRLYRRSTIGTYINLAGACYQAGFVLRRGVWHHVAIAWELGDPKRKPSLRLLIDGVPFGRVMFGTLDGVGDWTGEMLEVGSDVALHIAGLRIAAVSRLEALQKGVLSPPPDGHTLYHGAPPKE